jgi:hypothetical protein
MHGVTLPVALDGDAQNPLSRPVSIRRTSTISRTQSGAAADGNEA